MMLLYKLKNFILNFFIIDNVYRRDYYNNLK